jgi:hypothetical protein
MQKKLLLTAAAVALVAAGIAVALMLSRPPSDGGLDTALSDVTVITPPTTTVTTTAPRPKPVRSVDRRCWPMFGGDPGRSLARPKLDLGIPGRPKWARGLASYIEFPAV